MPPVAGDSRSSTPVLAFARLVREVHALIAQGEGDSSEAEAISERMDELWRVLPAQEQDRMRGLSIDLYALAEGGPKRIEMSADERTAWGKAAKEAFNQSLLGNVDAALGFLRTPIPSDMRPSVIAFLQARCWEKLGDMETALAFMEAAEWTDPANTVLLLFYLQRLGKYDEATACANRIINREGADSEELFVAAAALLQATRSLDDVEAGSQLRHVIHVLERAKAAPSPPQDRGFTDLETWIAYAIGLCQERLGDTRGAVKTYSDALTRNPRESELLVASGLARYDTDVQAALLDFADAVRLGSTSIWPWCILAHHAFVEGRPTEALRLAIQATEKAGPDEIRAKAYEIIAIASVELHQPFDRVEENFRKAIALDPANERIQYNFQIATRRAEFSQWLKVLRRSLENARIDPRKAKSTRDLMLTQRATMFSEGRVLRARDDFFAVAG